MSNVSATVRIRPFSSDDLNAVLEIQKLCKHAPDWRLRDYEQLAADPRGMILVAEVVGSLPAELLGFSVAYHLDEEAELWNLAVAPRFRRQGIARSLLREACRRLAGAGVQRFFLEVRSSNAPALELYHALGFMPLLTRKGYYQDPAEDAQVLVCKLTPPEG